MLITQLAGSSLLTWLLADLQRLNRNEKRWLSAFMTVIIASTVWFSASATEWNSLTSVLLNWLVAPVSAISGVLCVVLVARGLLSNWVWGLISTASYGLIAWTSGYYGDWLLNWCYFFPAQFLIYYSWRHQMTADQQVRVRHLGWHWLWVSVSVLIAIATMAMLLLQVDGFISEAFKRNSQVYLSLTALTGVSWAGPVLDSTTVVLQVTAQLLMIRMFAAQWPFWILTNLLTIFAWWLVLKTDPSAAAYAIPTLLMWLAFLINSVYGARCWYKGAAQQ